MGNIFFTADTHFGHQGILRHTRRPWLRDGDLDEKGMWVSEEIAKVRTDAMDQAMIEDWNNMVGHKDMTIIVGDFAWKDHRKYLSRLNGKKILILGSHDHMPQVSYDQFSEVHPMLMRRFNGHGFFIFHWACKVWQDMWHGSIHLYGHSHGRLPEDNYHRCTDVGVDVWNYRTVPIETIIAKMELKQEPDRDPDEIRSVVAVNSEKNKNVRTTSKR